MPQDEPPPKTCDRWDRQDDIPIDTRTERLTISPDTGYLECVPTVSLGGPGGYRGGGMADAMYALNLPAPDLKNRRGRFYFTEYGWREIGRKLAAEGRRRGHVVQASRQKNPPRSQILHRDLYQVVILQQTIERERRRR